MRDVSDKKAYLLILILLFCFACAAFIYLRVWLLQAFQEAVLARLSEYTARPVTVETTRLTLLEGFVVEDLKVYDETGQEVLAIPEISSGIFFPSLFKKGFVFPQIRIRDPVLRLVRLEDGRLRRLPLKKKPSGKAPSAAVGSVKITGGRIEFLDQSLSRPHRMVFDAARARISFDPSSGIKIHAKIQRAGSAVQCDLKAALGADAQDIRIEAAVYDLDLTELSPYIEESGLLVAGGAADIGAEFLIRDAVIHSAVTAALRECVLTRRFFLLKVNADLKAHARHELTSGVTSYAGRAACRDSLIEGLESVGPIRELNGDFLIDNGVISSENATASIWDLPVAISFMLSAVRDPLLTARLRVEADLAELQRVARERKFFGFPGGLSGPAHLELDLRTYPEAGGVAQVSGRLEVADGAAAVPGLPQPVSDIYAKLSFGKDRLQWADVRFRCGKRRFRSNGTLTDFSFPTISASCVSDEVSFDTIMTLNRGLADVRMLRGEYRRSRFDLRGGFFLPDVRNTKTSVEGTVAVEAQELARLLGGRYAFLASAAPEGLIEAEIAAEGIISQPDTLSVKAKAVSTRLGLYGLSLRDLDVDYEQSHGVIEIPRLRFSFYGGRVSAEATVNSAADGVPFWLGAAFSDVHIEELRQDTSLGRKELTGTLGGEIKLRGGLKKPREVQGAGAVVIKNGKLWELDLFKKLGRFLFSPEYFSSIVFKEGSATFAVRDEAVWSDDLRLKSPMSRLQGRMKVGFDGAIDGDLDVIVLDEMVPLTGTFKDVTTAIVGQADRFGSIRVTGTLQEPEYDFRTAVGQIIQGIGNIWHDE